MSWANNCISDSLSRCFLRWKHFRFIILFITVLEQLKVNNVYSISRQPSRDPTLLATEVSLPSSSSSPLCSTLSSSSSLVTLLSMVPELTGPLPARPPRLELARRKAFGRLLAIALMQEEVMAVQAEEVFQDDDLCWQHHVAAAKEGLTWVSQSCRMVLKLNKDYCQSLLGANLRPQFSRIGHGTKWQYNTVLQCKPAMAVCPGCPYLYGHARIYWHLWKIARRTVVFLWFCPYFSDLVQVQCVI